MNLKKFAAGLLFLSGTCLLVLTGCGPADSGEAPQTESAAPSVEIASTADIDELGMIEDKSVYADDDPGSIVCFYVTVQRGDAGSDTDHSFDEVKNVVRFINDSHVANDVYARAIVQVGDETGPLPGMLGYGVTESNARIRVRGNSSSVMAQKSYKLALDDEAGLWRGQSNIALNKSAFDVTRIKNKLYFDMLKDIPGISSIRTQFARLFIKDETSGQTQFEDYGFYTQAEVPTKKYLGNHGLDREGYLYKAISFNFEPSEALKNFNDPAFDLEAFETVLSCKGRQDNEKLMELVELINDLSVDINEIVGTYIDRENYITWLAYNILTANIDTTVQNFYLYNPVNSRKWYFIPWDGDNMLHVEEDKLEGIDATYGNWEHGISNYWGVILHQRFLKVESNRKELAEKVEELYKIITPDYVNSLVQEYNQVAEPYVTSMPDIYYLGHTVEERDQILAGLGDEITVAYQQFQDSLTELMPFFLFGFSSGENEEQILTWDEAYDFESADITYDVTVSARPDLSDPVISETGVSGTSLTLPADTLEEGTWYWTVAAHTDTGKSSMPMNKIQVNEIYYPGVDILEVTE
ncbi:MAG TPA: CotH kinase family protein [Candidatus Limivivens intestinipullorum]|uniref:CotH kinase family protein n=1 Tax=Candidatus Limivivens intestinipullorum TaxID=2840858 RepID=A0A9D1ES95_9FIRM|nr:CotH kinase family protein [Candidatus Limivivens intestinipullorum]